MSGEALSDTKRELLARLLAGKGKAPARKVPAADPDRRVRLSYAQERVWLTAQLAPDTPIFHLIVVVELPVRVESEMTEEGLRAVTSRHDALRTSVEVEDGVPYLRVQEAENFTVPVGATDVSAEPDPRAAALERAGELARHPYRLDEAPLWRCEVIHVGPDTSMLVLATHHIIADATSLDLIAMELADPLARTELQVTYRDFAAWQRDQVESGKMSGDLEFWRSELAGVPTSLSLPADRPRPSTPDMSGRTLQFDVPETAAARVRELGRTLGVTPYVLYLSVLGVLLGRYTQRRDILVGTYLAGREELELQRLVGMFVNLVPIRLPLSGAPSFLGLAERVNTATKGAFAHQQVPFEQLVREAERGTSRGEPPLVQVGFNMLRIKGAAFGEAVDLPIAQDVSQLDLTVHVVERVDGSHNLMLEYATALFDVETVERMAGHYLTLLDSLTAQPDRPVDQAAMLTAAERAVALPATGAAGADVSGPHPAQPPSLLAAFAERVRTRPDAVAVRAGEGTLSYRELDRRADRLARTLRARGAGPEHVVAVCLERGVPLVVALLAVWRAGAAYLPLDPEHPPARWATMRLAAGATLVLTDATRQSELADEEPLILDADGLPAPTEPGGPDQDTAEEATPDPDSAAYVIFTSGSTGEPKGVVITHAGIANRVWWAIEGQGLSATDQVLMKTRIGFDAAAWEIFAPLAVGGTVALAPTGVERDPAALLRAVADTGATVLQTVPSVLRLLVDQPGWEDCGALRLLASAGEPLDSALCDRVRERTAATLWNTYGPTECAIDVTAHRFEPGQDAGVVPIGEPLTRMRVTVRDPAGNPAPALVPGELLAGGPGVARGYVGRPDLTAERFVPDPYGPPGSRAYRTGDLVRRDPDGLLHYVGRVDDQLKINGVRIEPGEVNAALLRHPDVSAAHVLADRRSDGAARLIGYLVPEPGRDPSVEELRDWLGTSLPSALVPAAFVTLEALPLNDNGKVDRAALPALGQTRTADPARVAPRTAAERLVAEVWSQLLEVSDIGVEDDFFALGGHSLMLAQLAARLGERSGTPVAVHRLFGTLRLRDQAALLDGGAADDAPPPIRPLPREAGDELSLSFGQRRLWFLDQLTPRSPEYLLPVAVQLGERAEPEALRAALSDLADRHEVLRTRYVRHDGEPRQVIEPHHDIALEVLDAPVERVAQVLGERIREGFDLAAGPPWRALLIRDDRTAGENASSDAGGPGDSTEAPGTADDTVVLLAHHIVADGLSLAPLHRDLRELYRARTDARAAELPALPVQYADYAGWQHQWLSGARVETELDYWRERLVDLPYLELPADRPRPAVRDARGAVVPFRLPADVAGPLVAAGRARGASEFMSLLAPFALLLGRYSRQRDFAVGAPVAGRVRPELDDLVGFFVNTLVLRQDLSGDPTVGELLDRTRAGALEAYAHQYLPFERLVDELSPERDLSRTPLISVLFDVVDTTGPQDGAGVELDERFADLWQAAKFDQTWTLRAEPDGSYLGTVEYASALFTPDTVRAMTEHFVHLVRGAANPAARLSALELLPPEAHADALPAGPTREVTGTLPQLVERRTARAPEALAVVETGPRGRSLTYRELTADANRLAHHLRQRGVAPGDVVGVALPRGADLLVSVLAVWQAGAAFLPLDLGHPGERLAGQCADAEAVAVLCEGALPEGLPSDLPVLDVQADARHVATLPATAPEGHGAVAARDPEAAAYVMFTSGSTGRPKGVVVGHGAIANRVCWAVYGQGLSEDDRVLHKTRFGFDAAVLELFAPLAAGGTVALAEPDAERDPGALLGAVAEGGATVLQLVPSVLRMLLEVATWPALPTLRQVWLAGEPLDAELADRLRRRVDVRVWNTYGPTECAVDVTAHPVPNDPAEGPVPIGRSLPNLRPRVLDPDGRLVPAGVPGELYVGGAGLARGYAGRPDLTAERFVPDPYGPPGSRLYRTGDLVRYRRDGMLEFAGRVDDQVKVNGVRVEPGEIAAVLTRHSAVRDAVVIAREIGAGDRTLVAYLVPEGAAPSKAELVRHCREKLPPALVPGAFVVLDTFPLTPNGKLDRAALPAPVVGAATDEYLAPSGPLEELVAKLWAELLELPRVSAHTSFFVLGGNSLLAIRLVTALQQEFDVDLPVRVVFEGPTVAEQARAVEAAIQREVAALSDTELAAEAARLRDPAGEEQDIDGDLDGPEAVRSRT